MLARAVILLAASSTAVAGTVDVTVADCCKGASPACKAVIASLNYAPTCPTPGECKANGTGTINEAVTDANLELQLKLAGASILDKTVSACGDINIPLPLGLGSVAITAIKSCPVTTGTAINVDIDINNKIALPGKIASHAVAKDQDSNQLLCLDIGFSPQ